MNAIWVARIPRSGLSGRMVAAIAARVAAGALVLAGCSDSTTSPEVPAQGPPEGRQVGPSGWLVRGGPMAWSDATNEILAMGEVLAVPPTGDQALHGIDPTTGVYRVVDVEGRRLGVSGSGTHVYLTTITALENQIVPQLVERSLLDGSRRVWNEGVRFVLSHDDALLAYATAPWAGAIDSLVVEPRAGGAAIAVVPERAIPLAFSPDATQLLVWDGSHGSERVLDLADGSLVPLPLGIPAAAIELEPPLWDARGLLVIHAGGGLDSTIATLRNVTTGSETVLLRVAGSRAGPPAVVWSHDGRYAALFTQQAITVPDQQTPAREVSLWVADTLVPGARRIAYTWDAIAGRPLQEYTGTFSPGGTEFAWEAGGTLFVAPTSGAR